MTEEPIPKIHRKFSTVSASKKPIGTGNFSKVYDCEDGTCLKALRIDSTYLFLDLIPVAVRDTHFTGILIHPGVVDLKENAVVEEKKDKKTEQIFLMRMPRAKWDLHRFMIKHRTRIDLFDFTVQMLEACSYMTTLGVVHRDIKAANILVYENEGALQYKLTDFGSACQITMKRHNTETYTTYCNAPPEAFGKTGIVCSYDIWSLACVIFILVRGAYPFGGHKPHDIVYEQLCTISLPKDNEVLSQLYGNYWNRKYEKQVNKLRNQRGTKCGNLFVCPKVMLRGICDEEMQLLFYDLLMNMFKVDPCERFSANQCLSLLGCLTAEEANVEDLTTLLPTTFHMANSVYPLTVKKNNIRYFDSSYRESMLTQIWRLCKEFEFTVPQALRCIELCDFFLSKKTKRIPRNKLLIALACVVVADCLNFSGKVLGSLEYMRYMERFNKKGRRKNYHYTFRKVSEILPDFPLITATQFSSHGFDFDMDTMKVKEYQLKVIHTVFCGMNVLNISSKLLIENLSTELAALERRMETFESKKRNQAYISPPCKKKKTASIGTVVI